MFSPPPADIAGALEASAGRLGAFGDMRYCAEAGSTNDLALALALAGAPEGVSVLADVQRAGRGRRGREWFSPAGAGLYLSIIVRPRGPAHAIPIVTLAAGVASARSLRAVSGLPVELKWPNDIVIGRPWRKLGGVLCEAAGSGGQVETVVVGVGINLRDVAFPREIAGRAASVETELGRSIERAPLVVALLDSMREIVADLHDGALERVRRAWREIAGAGLDGARVWWDERGAIRRGRAVDIDEDGALLVDVAGRVERLIAGEVFWETLPRG